MVIIFICVLITTACVTGQDQDGTFLGTDRAKIADRELIELLVNKVTNMESEQLKQKKRIETLEDTVLKQNEIIADLQKSLREHVLEKTLNNASVSKDAEQDALPTDPLVKHKQWVKKEENAQQPRNVSRRQLQLPSSPVAFSALVSVHDLPHLGAHQNLVFDVTNVNTDSVYNTHHGLFTVPVSGVYVITSTVLAFNNREVWCDITVNGVPKAHIYARGTDGRHDQGTQTILLNLNQGDDVTIQNEATDDTVYGQLYTSFSGFLLYENEPSSIVG